jgi:hypothetical protein
MAPKLADEIRYFIHDEEKAADLLSVILVAFVANIRKLNPK